MVSRTALQFLSPRPPSVALEGGPAARAAASVAGLSQEGGGGGSGLAGMAEDTAAIENKTRTCYAVVAMHRDEAMAARRQARVRPVDAAIVRLMALAAKGVQPTRMAREVEVIAAEWRNANDAEPEEVRERLDELREQIVAGVGHAEEQVSDIDTSEPAAVKQANATLAALVATRDAAIRALAAS